MCLTVGSVYFLPKSDLNLYNIHDNVVDNLLCNYYNDKFLVLVDYNLTNVNWVINYHKIITTLLNNNLYASNILFNLSNVNLMHITSVGSTICGVWCEIVIFYTKEFSFLDICIKYIN